MVQFATRPVLSSKCSKLHFLQPSLIRSRAFCLLQVGPASTTPPSAFPACPTLRCPTQPSTSLGATALLRRQRHTLQIAESANRMLFRRQPGPATIMKRQHTIERYSIPRWPSSRSRLLCSHRSSCCKRPCHPRSGDWPSIPYRAGRPTLPHSKIR